MPAWLIPAIATGVSSLIKGGLGAKQMSLANKIKPNWDDSFVNKRLGMANNLFNARMFGAQNMERNIARSQANQLANIERMATDSSQALALAQGTQATADQAYQDLQTREMQNKYNLLDNLNNAYSAANQNMQQKFAMEMDAKNALRQSGVGNLYGAFSDLASSAIMGQSMGWFGKKPQTGSAFGNFQYPD